MRMTWVATVMTALLGVAASAAAQAIAPTDYFPLGDGYQWQYTRVAGDGPSDLHLEVTDVNVTDTGTRYFIDIPGNDVNLGMRLEIATDGSLVLRAVQADLNELLDGLPLDPSATADIQFSPPVLLGAASLVPGSAVVQTPVDTDFDADLDTNIGSVDLDVHTTGMIGAAWDPANATTVPAGSYSDVVGLTLDVNLKFSEDTFDTSGTVNERIQGVLARGVGFVQITVDGTTYALQRAIVNGVPIGDFPQYEDIVSLSFTATPPLIALNGRALGEATSGNVALHGIQLIQLLPGKTTLTATLDAAGVTGIPVSIDGPTKAKGDGNSKITLDGNTKVGDQKIKFHTEQVLLPTSTSFTLNAKVEKTKIPIPVGIVPVVSGDVHVSIDGLVDQSAQAGSTRKLMSNGRLRIGEVEYPVVIKETLKIKNNGTHQHTYNVKPMDNDTNVVHMEATATSAADFTITKINAKLYKREIKKKSLSNVRAEVVQP